MTDALAKRIAQLEDTLGLPGLPDAAREVIEQQLRELRIPAARQGWTGVAIALLESAELVCSSDTHHSFSRIA